MTPEEKVQKITDLLLARNLAPKKLIGAIDQVVRASELEERWLKGELVYDVISREYRLAEETPKEDRRKLPPQELAATVASRIEDAKWAAIGKDGTMEFFKERPTFNPRHQGWEGILASPWADETYCIFCPVEDPEHSVWHLEEQEQ